MQYTEFTSITTRLAGSYEQRQMVFQDLYGSLNPRMTGGQMLREPGMTDRRSYADRDPDQQRMPGRPVEDSVVLVTGAASGIGRAAAVELGAQGACVFACDRDGRGVEAVVASIESAGGRAAGCWLDVASKSEVDAAVRAALLQFGRVDGLVANAGVPSSQSFLAVTEQELDEVFAVNVKGVMFCGQAVATVMRGPARRREDRERLERRCGRCGTRPVGVLSEQGSYRHADPSHGVRARPRGRPGQRRGARGYPHGDEPAHQPRA